MARARAHLVISGTVQGVFFRDSMRVIATRYDVTGWVKNLPGGQVEAVLEGEEPNVKRVIAWSERGPIGAEVEDVNVDWEPPRGEFAGFSVRR